MSCIPIIGFKLWLGKEKSAKGNNSRNTAARVTVLMHLLHFTTYDQYLSVYKI